MRIALTGYSRVGKDEVAAILMDFGLTRVAFGDIIKRQLDPLIREHLGFSAFTEADHEKKRIRTTLESWGYANYSAILSELMTDLPEKCVNSRLFRTPEAKLWREAGGVVWHVVRNGCVEHTPNEREETRRMWDANLVDLVLPNHGSLDDLRRRVTEEYEALL